MHRKGEVDERMRGGEGWKNCSQDVKAMSTFNVHRICFL